MASPMVATAVTPAPVSASALIKTGNGVLRSFFCSAASNTPAVTIHDGVDATGTAIIQTFTPVSGVNYNFDAIVQKGLYIEITGTVSGTVLYI